MSNGILASIEKLKGSENYVTWKFAMENYLCHEGLDSYIADDTTSTTSTSSTSQQDPAKEKKAKSLLILSIDKTIYVHVSTAKTAKEVWKKLKATYEDIGMGRKISLIRTIVNSKLESCDSMESYVSNIMTASHSLTEIGFAVPDDWLAIFLLTGLTDEYGPMIMALENTSAALTSDGVKSKLLQEKKSLPSESAFYSKNRVKDTQRKDIICYTCRKRGHTSRQCRQNKQNSSGEKSKNTAAFSAVFLSGKFEKSDWYIDSGATCHMTMHREWIDNNQNSKISEITAANGEIMRVDGSGSSKLTVRVNESVSTDITIHDVLCVPGIAANLLSVSQITDRGNKVHFFSDRCEIRSRDGVLLAKAMLVDGLYRLNGAKNSCMLASDTSFETWHRRLGHLNATDLARMKNGAVDGLSCSDENKLEACVACLQGKHSRKPYKYSGKRAANILDVVHSDLCGPIDKSIGGSRYCFVLVDDYSRHTFVYFLKTKDETFSKFCAFKAMVEKQTGKKLLKFRSDNGTEYINNRFVRFFDEEA